MSPNSSAYTQYLRKQLWYVDLGGSIGRKPMLIVSNNNRNRRSNSVLAVRCTSKDKSEHITVVQLTNPDSMEGGSVVCDDLHYVPKKHIQDQIGIVTEITMRRVEAGLRFALDLRDPRT